MTRSCPLCGTQVSATDAQGRTKHRTRMVIQKGERLTIVCPGKGCSQEIHVGWIKARRIVLPVDRGAAKAV